MSYEVKQRGDKFVVVDMATKRIRGTYDSEDDAEDRKDDLEFKNEVREKLARVPVTEMTAEEKAAAYDKMIADKGLGETDTKRPPKLDEDKDKDKSKVRRSAYWGDLPSDD